MTMGSRITGRSATCGRRRSLVATGRWTGSAWRASNRTPASGRCWATNGTAAGSSPPLARRPRWRRAPGDASLPARDAGARDESRPRMAWCGGWTACLPETGPRAWSGWSSGCADPCRCAWSSRFVSTTERPSVGDQRHRGLSAMAGPDALRLWTPVGLPLLCDCSTRRRVSVRVPLPHGRGTPAARAPRLRLRVTAKPSAADGSAAALDEKH